MKNKRLINVNSSTESLGSDSPKQTGLRVLFDCFSAKVARGAGSIWVFTVAVLLVIVWAVSGPLFGFSSVWQLVINTITTIVTFLMVFLIQHTQNKDSEATQLKLDELLRALQNTDKRFVSVEERCEQDLEELKEQAKSADAEGEGGDKWQQEGLAISDK